MTHDAVNSPRHYLLHDGTEVIEHLQSLLPPDQYIGYLKGTALAYIARCDHKGGAQDALKAAWYCNRLALVLHEQAPPPPKP